MYTLLTINLHLLVWLSTTPSCGSEGDWLQWRSQETFCCTEDVQFLLYSMIDTHPWTFFFPTASLHNQCMPWILIWDENSLRKREMESLPTHIHYMSSGASGKTLRLPGMSWKKWWLRYFLILVPKYRELKVNILGQPWRNLLWKVRWHYCRSFYEEVVCASLSVYIAWSTHLTAFQHAGVFHFPLLFSLQEQ